MQLSSAAEEIRGAVRQVLKGRKRSENGYR